MNSIPPLLLTPSSSAAAGGTAAASSSAHDSPAAHQPFAFVLSDAQINPVRNGTGGKPAARSGSRPPIAGNHSPPSSDTASAAQAAAAKVRQNAGSVDSGHASAERGDSAEEPVSQPASAEKAGTGTAATAAAAAAAAAAADPTMALRAATLAARGLSAAARAGSDVAAPGTLAPTIAPAGTPVDRDDLAAPDGVSGSAVNGKPGGKLDRRSTATAIQAIPLTAASGPPGTVTAATATQPVGAGGEDDGLSIESLAATLGANAADGQPEQNFGAADPGAIGSDSPQSTGGTALDASQGDSGAVASLIASDSQVPAAVNDASSPAAAVDIAVTPSAAAASGVDLPAVSPVVAKPVASRGAVNPVSALGLTGSATLLQAAAAAEHARGLPAAVASFADAAANATQPAGGAAIDSPQGGISTLRVASGVDSPQFGQSVAGQVSLMVDKNMNSARLEVNPPALGPIEVHITLQGAHAAVSFAAHSALTRDALQSTAPQLREMLSSQGFGQVSVDISQRSFQDRPAPQQAYSRSGDESAEPSALQAAGRRAPIGALDAYA